MKLRDQKGQALVELALILPLMLLILFGITEFGRALYMVNTLNNAAREGARRAAVSSPLDSATLQTYIEGCIPFDKTGLDIDINPTNSPPQHGIDTIEVIVTLPFQSMVPMLEGLESLKSITLRGEASMLYE